MKAVVWHGRGDLRLEDVPQPDAPGPDEVLVRVAYCGICGTDLQEYRNGPVMIRPGPHPLTGEQPPLVLGHEFSGKVDAVGRGVTHVTVGDRVAVDPCWRCGSCYWCVRGDYHICRLGGSVGLASNGALAPLVRVQAAGVVPVPDDVELRLAALAEPLAVGLHAVRRAGIEPGDTVAILGFGPIGAAVLLAARVAGATTVLVSEPTPGRRELARTLRASAVFDPATDDIRRELYVHSGRLGPDVVFECTGREAVVELALSSVRRGGRVALVGIAHGPASLDVRRVTLLEQDVVGVLGYNHDIPRVLDLMSSGTLDPAPLISEIVALEDAVDGAFVRLESDPGTLAKVLVHVGGAA